MPEFVLRDEMAVVPEFKPAYSLCIGCGQPEERPYVDLGIGAYGSDLSQKPGVGIRYLCRTCVTRIARAVGFAPTSAVDDEAQKAAELERRLQAAEEQAKGHWDELSPSREKARTLELELADSEQRRKEAEARLIDIRSGEAEARQAREKMNAVLAALAKDGENAKPRAKPKASERAKEETLAQPGRTIPARVQALLREDVAETSRVTCRRSLENREPLP
jgi:septal ring factor EnvC (AmiA/AmiB activator)